MTEKKSICLIFDEFLSTKVELKKEEITGKEIACRKLMNSNFAHLTFLT